MLHYDEHFLSAQCSDWLRLGFRDRSRDCVVNRIAAHVNANERRDAGLLHRHAVDGIRRLGCRSRIVRDDDELRVGFELIQHSNEATDVRVVERGIDFVEKAERARLGEEDSEQQ